jgi:hypothetical protein
MNVNDIAFFVQGLQVRLERRIGFHGCPVKETT